MAIQEFVPEFIPWARIKVVWVWWAWCNTINRMIQEGLEGVEFIAINTDAQALANNLAEKKINIWLNITRWLWAGANPEIWRRAAEENIEEIKKALQDADMVFITAWMWGWTWTWAAPVIAAAAKEMGILTVGVVTKPFSFEWKRRMMNAIEWLQKMKEAVDTMIVIPNDKIFNIIDKKTTFKQAFAMIDKILHLGVQGISDLIVKPWDINIDFADIKVIMENSWTALLWIWYWEWENRAVDAARQAIENPLLEARLEWAKNIIFAVTWGDDLTPIEVQEAANVIADIADEDANIIWWMTFDPSYEWEVKVTIIATGFPEVTQQEIIQWKSNNNPIFMSNKISGRKKKWIDFVNKAIKEEGIEKKVQTFMPAQDDEYDETPAFIKKRLLGWQ